MKLKNTINKKLLKIEQIEIKKIMTKFDIKK